MDTTPSFSRLIDFLAPRVTPVLASTLRCASTTDSLRQRLHDQWPSLDALLATAPLPRYVATLPSGRSGDADAPPTLVGLATESDLAFLLWSTKKRPDRPTACIDLTSEETWSFTSGRDAEFTFAATVVLQNRGPILVPHETTVPEGVHAAVAR